MNNIIPSWVKPMAPVQQQSMQQPFQIPTVGNMPKVDVSNLTNFAGLKQQAQENSQNLLQKLPEPIQKLLGMMMNGQDNQGMNGLKGFQGLQAVDHNPFGEGVNPFPNVPDPFKKVGENINKWGTNDTGLGIYGG